MTEKNGVGMQLTLSVRFFRVASTAYEKGHWLLYPFDALIPGWDTLYNFTEAVSPGPVI